MTHKTVAQALKEKNKRLSQINKLWERLALNNSIPEGNTREFNPNELVSQIHQETDEYIELKTRIHRTCEPVRDKVFRLSELKNFVKKLKNINTKNGLHLSRYESTPLRYNTFLTSGNIDLMIDEVEKEIDELQEALDQFNHTTRLT